MVVVFFQLLLFQSCNIYSQLFPKIPGPIIDVFVVSMLKSFSAFLGFQDRNTMLRWFPTLFGFTEAQLADAGEIQPTLENFIKTKENFKVVNSRQIQSLSNGRVFTMGVFSTPSLRDLRDSVSSYQLGDRSENTGIITYEHIPITDILKMHSENPGSTFQAASQFNCLEFGAPHITPEYGITSYAYDETQGPACALACAAGTVYRNYFVRVSNDSNVINSTNENSAAEGQSEDSQLNTLNELELLLCNQRHQYWNIRNGYSFATTDSLTRLNLALQREWPEGDKRDELRAAVKVGVQEEVGVTFSRRFTAFDSDVRIDSLC
jgi:hypothetical protein